ncbi:hypothetical protein O7626_02365 [Micromonospora sp. WMMD1102]|uniref:hypothetical protein n=1 Tax=Micromonospora sp. WMMD1102 TaxID=3016105 RepID=UPI002414EBF5|nr:hypothetical protein [Micromonospora sp. WMMD1102]MDG4784786.1 hypothetical protein [Micromonospora sp. WMMD1102]
MNVLIGAAPNIVALNGAENLLHLGLCLVLTAIGFGADRTAGEVPRALPTEFRARFPRSSDPDQSGRDAATNHQ